MPKPKTTYICSECGKEQLKWVGRCPACGLFSTYEERTVQASSPGGARKSGGAVFSAAAPVRLSEIDGAAGPIITPTGIGELDRVLNGGIVEGSLLLIGGEPGIGKSTLLLQVCDKLGKAGADTLYVSGEESARQIKLRADRLSITTDGLSVLSENNLESILAVMENRHAAGKNDIILIDSIQTVYSDESASQTGSVSQVRGAASLFMRAAKTRGTPVILVSHVTKDGGLAGPKILEHMVDTVLYFEGERHAGYRVIRSVKNRFGPAGEIGVFEMRGTGLEEIKNPSQYMLSGRSAGVPGSVVTATMEGSRPLLTEVQSLVAYSNFPAPRRTANGMDYNRVAMLLAVLEKRAGIALGNYDSYVNIAGGLKIMEPAADLAVLAATAGNFKNAAVPADTVIFGEVGLTGEVRGVTNADKRVAEARKLGFRRCVLPSANMGKNTSGKKDMELLGVSKITEMMDILY
ncbi:MAG: DNA repair protein RadA [Clostridiales bacterium]|jgi:DNA repair protein RadA/Sms|nr:DNA repair protein RadA [Clostridiales bacterium]